MQETEEKERRFYAGRTTFLLLMIVCEFIWALAVPLTKICYSAFRIEETDVCSIFLLAGVRLFVAGTCGLFYCKKKGISLLPSSGEEWFSLIKLSAIMSVLQYILFYLGAVRTQGVVASLLIATSSFQGVLVSSLVFREDRLTLRKLLGCALGMLSVIILNFGDLRGGLEISLLGSALVFFSQTAASLGMVYTKYISSGRNATWVGGWQGFLGGCFLIFTGLLGGGRFRPAVPGNGMVSLIVMSLTSGVALILSNQIYKYNEISKVAIFSLLSPIFGMLTSAMLLGESLASAALLASLAVSCLGVLLVTTEKQQGTKECR